MSKKKSKLRSESREQTPSIRPLNKIPNIWVMRTKSSTIKLSGYNPATKTLYLQFKATKDFIYVYKNVAGDWWFKFSLSESKGKFFADNKMALVDIQKLPIVDKKK